jgi:hypothetical protein
MRCKFGVLLVDRFLIAPGLGGATTEESVYDSARMKQVPNRTEKGVGFRLRWRIRGESLEVGPLLGYECATSLRQNQNQMQFVPKTALPKNSQFFTFQRMLRTSDGDMFGEVLVVGSVSWGPSTKSITLG